MCGLNKSNAMYFNVCPCYQLGLNFLKSQNSISIREKSEEYHFLNKPSDVSGWQSIICEYHLTSPLDHSSIGGVDIL